MSSLLSKFDELARHTSVKPGPSFASILQQITKNKKALIFVFAFIALITVIIETNQHDAIIAAIPSISISGFQEESTKEPTIPEVLLFEKFGSDFDNTTSFQPDQNEPKFSFSDDDIDKFLRLSISERMDLIFPYKTEVGFIEKNIFQQHKSRKLEDLGRDITKYVNSWKLPNEPDFKHTLFDNQMIYRFLLKEFGVLFPEIIELYHKFPKNILRYDLFRYLVLYVNGGTYSDTDTVSSKPFSEWLSYNETVYGMPNSIGAVIGPEGESDLQEWERLEGRRIQFCQWTLQFKKHHPILKTIILNIIKNYETRYDPNTKIFTAWNGKQYNFNDPSKVYVDGVIEFTGPTLVTDSLYEYMNSLDPETFEIESPNNHEEIYAKLRSPHPNITRNSYVWEHDINRNVGWENFTNIQLPLVVNKDIMVVPRFYFNPRHTEEELDDRYLVRHNYHGDWKNSDI